MERCPNCGAATRPGAKFCTTCGYRLPERPPDDGPTAVATADPINAEAPDWPTPNAGQASDAPATDAAPGPPPADATPPPAESVTEPPAAVAAEADDRVLDSSWPTQIPSAWTAGWERRRQSTVDESAPTAAADAADADPPPGWEVATFGAPEPAPVAATEHEAGDPETTARDDDPGDAAPPPFAWDRSDWDVAADDAASEEAPPLPEAGPASAFALDAVAPPPPPIAGDATKRAIALLDEVRALLPRLGTQPPDLEAIVDDLEAVLAADDPAQERASLRAALVSARDRPRDIDTIVDLSGRVDAVLALLESHDRAVAAIERATAALRSANAETA